MKLMPEKTEELLAYFWERVDSSRGFLECWNWTGTLHNKHYGLAYCNNKEYRAHRLSYYLWNDKDPKHLKVCHSCDNPSCVNPQHLWLGTQKDNMADRNRKGRQARGSKHGNSKLTESQVRVIRRLLAEKTFTQRQIAQAFGVSAYIISDIKTGRKWGWLPS